MMIGEATPKLRGARPHCHTRDGDSAIPGEADMINARLTPILTRYRIGGTARHALQFCPLKGILKHSSPRAGAVEVPIIQQVLIEVSSDEQSRLRVGGLNPHRFRGLFVEGLHKPLFSHHRGAALVAVPGENDPIHIPICAGLERDPCAGRPLSVGGGVGSVGQVSPRPDRHPSFRSGPVECRRRAGDDALSRPRIDVTVGLGEHPDVSIDCEDLISHLLARGRDIFGPARFQVAIFIVRGWVMTEGTWTL